MTKTEEKKYNDVYVQLADQANLACFAGLDDGAKFTVLDHPLTYERKDGTYHTFMFEDGVVRNLDQAARYLAEVAQYAQ